MPAGALLLTTVIATFVSMKLFRWEKEQKIPARSKLWVVAAFLPFVLLGAYQAKTRDNLARNELLERTIRRGPDAPGPGRQRVRRRRHGPEERLGAAQPRQDRADLYGGVARSQSR